MIANSGRNKLRKREQLKKYMKEQIRRQKHRENVAMFNRSRSNFERTATSFDRFSHISSN